MTRPSYGVAPPRPLDKRWEVYEPHSGESDERSESMSGARFPARGSRPRTDKAGAASAAAEPIERHCARMSDPGASAPGVQTMGLTARRSRLTLA